MEPAAPSHTRPHSPRVPGTSHAPTVSMALAQTLKRMVPGSRRINSSAFTARSYQQHRYETKPQLPSEVKLAQVAEEELDEEEYAAYRASFRPLTSEDFSRLDLENVTRQIPNGWESPRNRSFGKQVSREMMDRAGGWMTRPTSAAARPQSAASNSTRCRTATPTTRAPTAQSYGSVAAGPEAEECGLTSANPRSSCPDPSTDHVDPRFYYGNTPYTHARPSPRTRSTYFNRPGSAASKREAAGFPLDANPVPAAPKQQRPQSAAPRTGTGNVLNDGSSKPPLDNNTNNTIEQGLGGFQSTRRGPVMARMVPRDEAAYAAHTGPNPRKERIDMTMYYGTTTNDGDAMRRQLLKDIEKEKQIPFEPYSIGYYEVKDTRKKRAPSFAKCQPRRPLHAPRFGNPEETVSARRERAAQQRVARVDSPQEGSGHPLNAMVEETVQEGIARRRSVFDMDALASTASETQSLQGCREHLKSITHGAEILDEEDTAALGAKPGNVKTARPISPTRVHGKRTRQIHLNRSLSRESKIAGYIPESHLKTINTSSTTPRAAPVSDSGVRAHISTVNIAKGIPKPPLNPPKKTSGLALFPKYGCVDRRTSSKKFSTETFFQRRRAQRLQREEELAMKEAAQMAAKRDSVARQSTAGDLFSNDSMSMPPGSPTATSGSPRNVRSASPFRPRGRSPKRPKKAPIVRPHDGPRDHSSNDRLVHPKTARDFFFGGIPGTSPPRVTPQRRRARTPSEGEEEAFSAFERHDTMEPRRGNVETIFSVV